MTNKILAISNGLFLIATLIINFLANRLPLAGRTTGDLSDLYPNLFVPAGFTFSIWGVIYALLIAFVVWQIVDAWNNSSIDISGKIGPWFIISCVANIGRIIMWHYTQIELSLVLMVLLLTSLIIINHKIDREKKRGDRKNKLCTQTTFAVYLGWISVATIANVTTLLVEYQWGMRGLSDIFRTNLVIGVATILGLTAVLKKASIPYALVVLRAFWGIASKRVAIDALYAENILRMLGVCSLFIILSIGWKRKTRRHN